MRCTRCDRIAVPQAVGRLPDGRIAFGWCLACLIEADCQLVDGPHGRRTGRRFGARRPDFRSRAGPIPDPIPGFDPEASGRRRLVVGIAAALGAWAAILIGLGLARLSAPGSPGPLGGGSAAILIIGGGLMALTGLWLGVSAPGRACRPPAPRRRQG